MSAEYRDTVNNWLAEIGALAGQVLKLNDDGLCALEYEGQVFVVDVPQDSSQFYLYTALMTLPPGNTAPLLRKILEMNHLQIETKGGGLSVDPTTNEVVFCYRDRIQEIDSNLFRNVLENFIDKTLTLLKDISGYLDQLDREGTSGGGQAGGSPPPAAPGMGDEGFIKI